MAFEKRVFIVGVGMGNPDTLTIGAQRVIDRSGLLIGAERLLEQFPDVQAEKLALVHSDEIAEAVRNTACENVAVLMSGDTGLFSGAKRLVAKLSEAGNAARVLPGISSVSYLAALLQVSWDDAHVISAHGRECNVVGAVQSHAKTFVLTGGKTRAADLCREMAAHGLSGVVVHAGERLSYPDERVVTGTAAELAEDDFADLTVLFVENPRPIRRDYAAPSIPDEAFMRSQAPMTKEEIRMLAMAKLHIRPDDVIWDIGAGTGSTSIEAALAANEGRVIAVEKNREAVATLRRNLERFGTTNVEIAQGEAPEVLAGLPAPDRVFMGGTSGRLVEIVEAALAANPQVRIVANGVTLEMARDMLGCLETCALKNVEIAQVAVAKSHELGSYHLMFAKNPVLVFSADGPQAEEFRGAAGGISA